jgi:hypothetical protein
MNGTLVLADGRRYWQRFERGEGRVFLSLTPVDGVGPRALVEGPSTMTVDELLDQAEAQLQPRRAPKRRLAGS